MRPTILALALAVTLPGGAGADVLDDVFESRCGILLDAKKDLFRPEAVLATDAIFRAWRLLTWEVAIEPPFEDVCRANPKMTVEEAMRASIQQALQDRR